ncbi:MAG: phosphotransferase [Alphaproteobacteria bacterium]|jgi:thiamine kinase-like enzyme|nr:phosphotransferase [Alphaproteobacteria bacterium]MDP6591025.1 phosphotransferase [Alphaproteobacteria bacterium]MDP6817206.1 phosphotransferase [Alphaproteobacteria bacterium]
MAEEIDSAGVFDAIGDAQGAAEMSAPAIARAKALPIWRGEVVPQLLSGGLSNINLTVEDAGKRYVVRIGGDEPSLGVFRANEVMSLRAAHAAGVAAEVFYDEPGLTVLGYIPGRALTPDDMHVPDMIAKAARLIRRMHSEAHKHLDGTGAVFWPFHHNRWYVRQLAEHGAALEEKWRALLPNLVAENNELEAAIGRAHTVYGHNDINPQNIIIDDDGRLWFVDLEYAGFGMDLFDMGVLAMNSDHDETEDRLMLESYYEAPPDEELARRYTAAKATGALREFLWGILSQVSERPIEFDYSIYADMFVERYQRFLADFRNF